MNDIPVIVSFAVVGGIVFGAIWIIVEAAKKSTENHIEDVKKGVHARVDRAEHAIDGIIEGCNKKKEDYITTKAFDRFELHQNTKFQGLTDGINHLTVRIDDFIKTNRNGKTA